MILLLRSRYSFIEEKNHSKVIINRKIYNVKFEEVPLI